MLPRGRGDGNPGSGNPGLRTERSGEESTHPPLVFRPGGAVKVDVRGARYLPQLLGRLGAREESVGLGQRRVTVSRAGNDEHGRAHALDAVDRPEIVGTEPETRPELQREQRRQWGPKTTESDGEAVIDRLREAWIDRLQHQRLDAERLGAHQHRRPAQRDADHADPLTRRLAAQEPQHGAGVEALEIAKRDPLAPAFAVATGVEKQHGIAGGVEKARSIEHIETAAVGPMEQEDGAPSTLPGHEPALERTGGGTEQTNGPPWEISGQLAHRARRGRGESPRRPVAGARAGQQEQRGEGAESPGYFTSPA